MAWLKRRWMWLLAALAAVAALVVTIVTRRPRPKPVPRRPDTPDVDIPDAPPLDTTPSDDYEAQKVEPKVDGDEVMDDINRRYQ